MLSPKEAEYQKEYRRKNRVELNAKQLRRYRQNRSAIISRRKKQYWANRDEAIKKRKSYWKKYAPRVREEMIAAYGNACACCGEKIHTFLEIDHINGDAKEHRRKRLSGVYLYRWLKMRGWPKENFQLLCSNCNIGKFRNGGVCPHQEMRLESTSTVS